MSCLFLMILGLPFFFIMQPGTNITILRAGHLTFLPEGNLITQEACCFLANKSKQQSSMRESSIKPSTSLSRMVWLIRVEREWFQNSKLFPGKPLRKT